MELTLINYTRNLMLCSIPILVIQALVSVQ